MHIVKQNNKKKSDKDITSSRGPINHLITTGLVSDVNQGRTKEDSVCCT